MGTKSLFRKYQGEILSFANTDWGKDYLSDIGYRLEKSDKIVRLTPNSIFVLKDFRNGHPIFQASFHSRIPFHKKIGLALDAMDIAERESAFRYASVKNLRDRELILPHHLGFISPRRFLPLVMMNSSTFNPAAGANTPVDGSIKWQKSSGQGEAWATLVAEAAANNTPDVTEAQNGIRIIADNGNYRGLYRAFYLFDTSSLTSGAVISAATFSVFGSLTAGTTGLIIRPYTSSPANTNNLVAADFSQVGSVAQSDTTSITSSNWSTVAYNDYAFNATGIGNISLTGISKFCIRFEDDVTATDPGITNGNECDIFGNYADNGSNIPKLVVTFSLAASIDVNDSPTTTESVNVQETSTNAIDVFDSVSTSENLNEGGTLNVNLARSGVRII